MTMPNASIAEAFGATAPLVKLQGGRGLTHRSGDIVLKPAPCTVEANWLGETFNTLARSSEVRFPRPVRSKNGNWIEEGVVAWTYLPGTVVGGDFKVKMAASQSFHDAVRSLKKPAFLDTRDDPWSQADRVAWQEKPPNYELEFMALIAPFLSRLEQIDLPSQIIHGDLSGNVIFTEHGPPGVIDITPYWRPVGYAAAIIVVDTIWDEGPPPDLSRFNSIPSATQLMLRAFIRRMAEQPEHVRYLGKPSHAALETAKRYHEAGSRLLIG